ncbi:MAG: DUF5658 family protein [Actinobacteria bacterium]|nr:DUF5658 family protein [Actinomycetota bacterium]
MEEYGSAESFQWLSVAGTTLLRRLNLADIASTLVAIRMGLLEGNYLPSIILSTGSELMMYCFKLFAVSLVIAILVKLASTYPRLWYGLYAGNAIMVIVVLGNLATLAEAGAL